MWNQIDALSMVPTVHCTVSQSFEERLYSVIFAAFYANFFHVCCSVIFSRLISASAINKWFDIILVHICWRFISLYMWHIYIVCVSACLRGYLRIHTRDLYSLPKFLCMLPMAVARSSSGVVAIRYVLPVLWMTLCFFVMGRSSMNFATMDRFRGNSLIYREVGQNSISYY